MYHSLLGAWTPAQVIQAVAAIFALLSAWAWAKSAMLQLRPDHKPDGLDRLLERSDVATPVARKDAGLYTSASHIH